MPDYYDRIKTLTELASYDISEPYEVDKGGIYWDPAISKFVFITASGCSCWDGDYDEGQYDTLLALYKAEAISGLDYSPSLKTFEKMLRRSNFESVGVGIDKLKAGLAP